MMKRPWFWLVLALAIGAFARLWRLTEHSLFLDEAFSIFAGSLPLDRLLDFLAHDDAHPPLFYFFAHGAIAALHWQPWLYRFLTAPFGLVTIVATWGIARRVSGNVAAAFAALFVAISPDLIDWDRMFRMYSALVALSALSWWVVLEAQRAEGARKIWLWIAYCAIAAVLPSTQYLGAVTLLSQAAYALSQRMRVWPVYLGCALGAIGLVPWLGMLRSQYAFGGHVVSGAGAKLNWLVLARESLLHGIPNAWHAGNAALDTALSLVVIAAICAGAWIARKTVLPYWLSPIVVQIVAGFALHKDLVVPRYLLPMIPAFAVALGAVLERTSATRFRVAAVAIGGAFLTLSAIAATNVLLDPYYQRTDWYAVDILMLRNEEKNDAIVVDQGFAVTVIGGLNAFTGHDIFAVNAADQIDYALRWIDARPKQRIWYVENQWFYPDPHRLVHEHLRKTRGVRGGYFQDRSDDADRALVVLFDAEKPLKKR
jgi:4-amino-4-deoxy-L-arabinose transferase-like glycosyltransferase